MGGPVARAKLERSASDRMHRTMYFAIGTAAFVFGVLLSPGSGGFLGQLDQLYFPFAIFTVATIVALPATFPVLTFLVPDSVMRILVAVLAIGFVASQVFFIAAMSDEHLADGASPWFQGFGAIPAALLAVAWSPSLAWAFAIAQGPLVAIVALFSSADTGEKALLDGLGAMVTCTILVGVATAVVSGATQQDAVAATAAQQASVKASAITREREQSRINAMVHDDIMSVLLSASRTPAPAALATQAAAALRSVEMLTTEDSRRVYTPQEFVAILRSTVGEVANIQLITAVESDAGIPSDAVAAVAEATAEAVRNSVLHAGDDVPRTVGVTVDDAGLAVRITDDGRGFSLRSVAPRRLGIRVSILERMRTLTGGDAAVTSRPGAGTTVDLTWQRVVA